MDEGAVIKIADLEDKVKELESTDYQTKIDFLVDELWTLQVEVAEKDRNFLNMMTAVILAQGGQVTVSHTDFDKITPDTTLIRFENQDGDIVFKVVEEK